MDGDIGSALAATGTSNAWLSLDAVAAKVGKRLGKMLSPKELDRFMVEIGTDELQRYTIFLLNFLQRVCTAAILSDSSILLFCRHGIWRTSFGTKLMPIVVINPAYARTVHGAGDGCALGCTCGATDPASNGKDEKNIERYFGSRDYNAGRHASTASTHKGMCAMWHPSTTSHLHSWRRGFT